MYLCVSSKYNHVLSHTIFMNHARSTTFQNTNRLKFIVSSYVINIYLYIYIYDICMHYNLIVTTILSSGTA